MKLQIVSNTVLSRLSRALAAFAVALPMLVACGGGGGGGGGSAATSAPTLTTATVGEPRYGQTLVLTLNGANLDQALTVTSAGCSSIVRSSAAPYVSTATTAYYTCTASAVGAQQFSVVRGSDNVALGSAAYTVPVPQVTLSVSNGGAVAGSLVLTLAPQQAPVTVNNFLAYVNSGFYTGTIFHRVLAGFVAQGGGYSSGVAADSSPSLKTTNAAITLEDNAGLSNTALTVAMARSPNPDTATSQFFINLVDNPSLNRNGTTRGYAVFGSVTSGANLVTQMGGLPCVAAVVSACLPIPNLVVSSAVQSR